MNTKGWAIVIIIVILVGAIVLYWTRDNTDTADTAANVPQQGTHAVFACDNGGSIDATFVQGEATVSNDPDMPPTPGGSVKLALSDGREMTLAQTISADGARYASADDSIVFWNVGNGATFTYGEEDGTATTVSCTASQ
jgi:hypothetical protein